MKLMREAATFDKVCGHCMTTLIPKQNHELIFTNHENVYCYISPGLDGLPGFWE